MYQQMVNNHNMLKIIKRQPVKRPMSKERNQYLIEIVGKRKQEQSDQSDQRKTNREQCLPVQNKLFGTQLTALTLLTTKPSDIL